MEIMKYLLLLALVFVVVWALRRTQMPRGETISPFSAHPSERMVQCVYCGVNQAVSECILENGRYFCCRAHQHEDEAREK